MRQLAAPALVWLALLALESAALVIRWRRRLQHAVDHRFDRSRYDAARTVDSFAQELR